MNETALQATPSDSRVISGHDSSQSARSDLSALSLRPPAHRVERRAVGWWMLQSVVLSVPILAAAIVAYVLWEAARPWLVLAIVAASLLLIVGVAVEPLMRYRVHRWETTPEAVYARSGWLVREWRAAPLSRVQTVDALRGPLEQLLGLSTLRVTTASSYGAIDIGGLDQKTAARLAEDLTEITQQTPGDAT
ncbi:PH domain-containing protein [Nesterenkonia muleiensis]|uniref:PH domain-containing protein n=1 Tax=Nesterenkonia muleiensis TaxID=2282648 RepID=UPI000E75573E|nr:PH domain-containing protein [Nesterenkonia muleiensis]